MIKIHRKIGWELNPNDKVINSILHRCELNDGKCPCVNNSDNPYCPCSDYLQKDICHCGLYLKVCK